MQILQTNFLIIYFFPVFLFLEQQFSQDIFYCMRKILFCTFLLACTSALAEGSWKFIAGSQEEALHFEIDLHEESIEVPGMEMFGPLNGYLRGKGIWGVWAVTSVKNVNDKQATIHLSNDQGSETQAVRLTLNNDSTCLFEQIDGNVMKRVSGRKLVKIPKKIIMKIVKH